MIHYALFIMHYNTKAATDEVCLHAKVYIVHVYLGSVVSNVVCNFVIETVMIISTNILAF